MSPTPRAWAGGGAAVLVLLLVASWLLVLSPQRAQAADLRDQTTAQEGTDTALAAAVHHLAQQYADLPGYTDRLAEIQRSIPADAALPALVREVKDAAASAGVSLDSLVPGTPTALAVPGPAATPSTTPVAAGVPAPAAPAPAPAAAATPQAAAPQTAAASSLVAIPVTLVVSGGPTEVELFLQALQRDVVRTVLVSSVAVAPGTGSGPAAAVSATVTGQVFALPAATGPATTAATGAAAPTTPSTSPSMTTD